MDRLQLAEEIWQFFYGHYCTVNELVDSGIVFTFGRADRQVAITAAAVYKVHRAYNIVVSGGIGKDSGDLPKLGLTEAGYLIACLFQEGVPGTYISGEFAATDGGENCRNGIALMQEERLIEKGEKISFILVGHWASLYRLYQMMETNCEKLGFEASYQLVPTPRPEVLNEKDIAELIAEFRRLMDWPHHKNPDGTPDPWLNPVELPANLVTAMEAL